MMAKGRNGGVLSPIACSRICPLESCGLNEPCPSLFRIAPLERIKLKAEVGVDDNGFVEERPHIADKYSHLTVRNPTTTRMIERWFETFGREGRRFEVIHDFPHFYNHFRPHELWLRDANRDVLLEPTPNPLNIA